MKSVNKHELINRIAEKMNMSKKDSELFIDTFVDVVTDALANDEKIKMYGFVSFEVVNVNERVGKNPKTSEEVIVPAHKKVRVKIGEKLKENVQ